MDKLPIEVIRRIYEYDSTYKIEFDKVARALCRRRGAGAGPGRPRTRRMGSIYIYIYMYTRIRTCGGGDRGREPAGHSQLGGSREPAGVCT